VKDDKSSPPLTRAEIQAVVKRAGPHRAVEFVFQRRGKRLRCVRARIYANS
jgi:hypothetical protein